MLETRSPMMKVWEITTLCVFQFFSYVLPVTFKYIGNGVVFVTDKLVITIVALVNQRQKQYLVKYQGLAHIHNCWLPESQLLIQAPDLVAKFNRKNEV